MRDATCWFCQDDLREQPPGGWLLDHPHWRAGHTPAAYSVAGTVVLEARRHVLDQAELDPAEAASLTPVTGRLIAAIRQATGCDRVYQWSTMDRFPHFHVWLIPWWETSPSRGPAYLVETVQGDGATEADAREAAGRIREVLTG